jgi:tetratricopeptide (TPR) repeat protein
MKYVVAVLTIFLCLQATVHAVPDSIAAGPYKVSFDLGIGRNSYAVNVTTGPEKKDALNGNNWTIYTIQIQNKTKLTQFMQLSILRTENEVPITKEEEDLRQLLTYLVNNLSKPGALPGVSIDPTNAQIEVRQMDGTSGGVASFNAQLQRLPGDKVPVYVVVYFPISDKGHARATIFSSYPWNGGILQFLKSLNIAYSGESSNTSSNTSIEQVARETIAATNTPMPTDNAEPTTVEGWNAKGQALFNQGKYDEAIQAYGQALTLSQNDVATWRNMGAAYEAKGDTDHAIQVYERLVTIGVPDEKDLRAKISELGNKGKS